MEITECLTKDVWVPLIAHNYGFQDLFFSKSCILCKSKPSVPHENFHLNTVNAMQHPTRIDAVFGPFWLKPRSTEIILDQVLVYDNYLFSNVVKMHYLDI